MDIFTVNNSLTIIISLLGAAVLIGFFATKTSGFGPFTASILLILMVIIFTAIFFTQEKVDSDFLSSMFFAVLGFAGGLFTSKYSQDNSNN